MGTRCRFVQPDITRLYLVDVHRRRHAELLKNPKATADDLKVSAASVAEAEADGEYIDVKKELTAGEQRLVFSGLVKEMQVGQKTTLNPEQVGRTQLAAYIVGWSFLDANQQPQPVTPDAIDHLDSETYQELVEAIDWHEAQIEAARIARKKDRGGKTTSPVISPSPSVAAGVSTGSEN